MNNRIKYIFTPAFIFLSAWLNGQDIVFEHITTGDGLSQSTVNAILQDQHGFMWFGTNDGLDKYDGYTIERFSHEKGDPNSLNKNSILSLYEDKQGFIWIGTYGGGLNRFDFSSRQFTHYEYNPDDPNSLSNNQVFEIFEDSENVFWIGTEQGIDRFYKEELRFEYVNNQLGVPFGKTEAITEDRFGDIWIAGGNGIFRYSRLYKSFEKLPLFPEFSDQIPGNFVWKVYADRKGDLWVGTMWGLLKYDFVSGSFRCFKPENWPEFPGRNFHVRNIFEDSQHNLWIGTDGAGVLLFNRQSETFFRVPETKNYQGNFSDNVVTSIFEDRNGNLWFGTFKSGINKIDRLSKKFQTFRHEQHNPESLVKSDIKAVYQDETGITWVGTEKGGLSRIDRETGKITTWLNNPANETTLPDNVVLSVVKARDNKLWIGTFSGGLSLFDPQTEIFERMPVAVTPAGKKSNVVWAIYPDVSQKLWIGTWGAGLHLFDPETHKYEHFDISEKGIKNNNSVLSICRDYQGFIWVGTYGDGLKRLNPLTREVQHFRRDDQNPGSLIDNLVHVVFEDKDRNLWVGTKDGLDLFNRQTGSFIHFSTPDGLPNNVINGILQDDENSLWISTNKGLTRFNPETRQFRNYNIHDGLQGNEFNRGVCFAAPNGEFLFGGVNGLNIFKPNEIQDNPYIPNVVVTGMKIKNAPVTLRDKKNVLQKHISVTKEITLPHDFSVVTFDFVALNFTKSEKNQYAFYLKNYDEDWRYVQDQRTATYTNLNPGEYEFFVKGSNNDGLWNEQGTSIVLTVLPPYWKTWWFRAIIVILIWSGFTLLFMIRTRMIKHQKMELEKLVAERTRELQLQKSKVESKNLELEKQKQEILRQRDQVEIMTRKVHEADQMKLRFFTNISHEFRTPLTLILGPVEKMLNSSFREEIQEQLSLVHRNALRLLRLVNEIMDFRKIETGRMKLRVTHNDLSAFVHDIYFSFNELAKRQKITYSFVCRHAEIAGWFDRDKVEKILFNLISNAFKFTPPGGEISVSVDEEERLFDEVSSPKKYSIITVSDNGRGITRENLEQIFERFYQVEGNSSQAWQGSGVGLSLTKNLLDIHYGNIHVTSEKWQGTTFTVAIPIEKDNYNTNEIVDSLHAENNFIAPLNSLSDWQSETKKSDNKNTGTTKKTTVLIVEDNADVRLYIKNEIGNTYNVLEAENGAEAVLIAKKHHIDLVVSDIMMPVMDGLELCKHLKTNLDTSHIPVILLTARTTDDYKLKGLETGADDYVFKPFNAIVLSARIKNLIETRKLLKQRFSQDIFLTPKDVTVTSPDEKFLTKALDIVEKNISDSDFNVDKLVEEIGMSRSVFYRKLKNLIGQSANDFIKTIRLKRAAQMLRQNKLTISEVSYEAGFSDPQYFSKCFHKHFGKTPSQFISETATLN
jgi:signal transduction histidine kinase/ligand-binding sensor domain-containing protein/CheY-like chemotaxis protein/AraC-like DNA-binding protein